MYTLTLKIPIDENKRIRGRDGIRKALRVLAGRIHGSITDDELMAMWSRALELTDPADDKIYEIVEDQDDHRGIPDRCEENLLPVVRHREG